MESWPAHPGLDFPALFIDAYDSSKGPWDPNKSELGGSMGVNGGKLTDTNPTIAPPCDSCGAAQVPVSAIVDHYAVAANNDNAAVGLGANSMSNLQGATRLDLPCGYYYLDNIGNSQGSVTIYAHGHTALFIGGNVKADVLSFSLDPTGSFDVFIKGTITTQSDLIAGNPNYAALSRTYVSSAFSLNGEAHISGLFYVANRQNSAPFSHRASRLRRPPPERARSACRTNGAGALTRGTTFAQD
jgi:hypothetical protein